MFDMICGHQVKCFYDEFSNGGLRNFKVGDAVPTRTNKNKYPDDFNILLAAAESETGKPVLIKIRNQKVFTAKNIKQTQMDDLNLLCINKAGETIKIASVEDAEAYSEAVDYFYREKALYIKKHMPVMRECKQLEFGLMNVPEEEREQRYARLRELKKDRAAEMNAFKIFMKKISKRYFAKFL